MPEQQSQEQLSGNQLGATEGELRNTQLGDGDGSGGWQRDDQERQSDRMMSQAQDVADQAQQQAAQAGERAQEMAERGREGAASGLERHNAAQPSVTQPAATQHHWRVEHRQRTRGVQCIPQRCRHAVGAEGYQRGAIQTNPDQSIATSTVFYADGERATGREVAKLLGIEDVQPLNPDEAALAPEADIVVLAGADQAP